MINNDTVATATIFGLSTGLMTEQWITIIVGAIAVGVIQPFFRILWTRILMNNKPKPRKRKRNGIRKKKR